MAVNYSFSGHESFPCKNFWLKKGYDYASLQKKFSNASAVVELGVGKNMVSSIQFWLKAFGLIEENELTPIAHYLFHTIDGKDPFIEDMNTLWLLHYQLVKTQKASIYTLLFNEYFKDKFDFDETRLLAFLERKSQYKIVKTSLKTDISVLIRNYVKLRKMDKMETIEESFTGLLIDLPLLSKQMILREDKKEEVYKLNLSKKTEIAWQIFLYVILEGLEHNSSKSISLKSLRYDNNSPGRVFGMTKEGIETKIEELTEHCSFITFTETAGNAVLQFKTLPNKFDILNAYYQR